MCLKTNADYIKALESLTRAYNRAETRAEKNRIWKRWQDLYTKWRHTWLDGDK